MSNATTTIPGLGSVITIGQTDSEKKITSKVMEQVSKVNWENVFFSALGSVCTLSFGFYTWIFAFAGGWWWAWAIPYGVLTLLAGGFTVFCLMNLFGPSAW